MIRPADEHSGDVLRHQVEEHPLIRETEFKTPRERVLHTMHERAYDEAVARAAGREVLDLGCNTGYGTLRLAAVARRTVGVDVNPMAIEEARRRSGPATVELAVIDGIRLPFPDASFDLVVSFQVIEHVADPAPYLAGIARVLRPDGMALFSTPNAAIRLDPGMPPWNRFHVREYRSVELPGVFAEAFDSVEVRGMFAARPLYDIEFSRVDEARRRHSARILDARRRQVGWAPWRRGALLRRPLSRLVPEWVARRARSLSTDRNLGEISTADFWYTAADLDRALDFLVICQAPRPPRPG